MDNLEELYLKTVWAVGIPAGGNGPNCASAAAAGDIVIRHGKEERIVEVVWDDRGVQVVTETRDWLLGPNEPLAVRKVPKSWAGLLDPEKAEETRRDILVKAFDKGLLRTDNNVQRANRLLGVDLTTGETLA